MITGNLGIAAAIAIGLADLALIVLLVLKWPGWQPRSIRASRYERGFEDAAIGMMILTPQLIVTRVNDSLCTLLGRDRDALIGHSILEFTYTEDIERSLEKRESMRRGEDAPLVKRYVRPDGSLIDVVVTTALIEPESGEAYYFSQLQDVTEQRRAERQKAAIADLGRRALESDDVLALMGEAMGVVHTILGTSLCLVTRRMASGEIRVVADSGGQISVEDPGGAGLTEHLHAGGRRAGAEQRSEERDALHRAAGCPRGRASPVSEPAHTGACRPASRDPGACAGAACDRSRSTTLASWRRWRT